MPGAWQRRRLRPRERLQREAAADPTPEFRLGEDTLWASTMVSTFGTALDTTAEELRVKTFFPMDEFSREFFRTLAA